MTNVIVVMTIMILGGALMALGMRFRTRRSDRQELDMIDKGFVAGSAVTFLVVCAVVWMFSSTTVQ